jgi:PIN domain nuclease of toxin-antitoxin system
VRALLDTVTFLWAVDSPELLSGAAASLLDNGSALLEVSALSLSEISIKRAGGKLSFTKEQLADGIADLRLRVLSFTRDHAYKLFELPMHHKDPFDRQIIAQAMAEGIPVVTSDRIFGAYEGLQVIW